MIVIISVTRGWRFVQPQLGDACIVLTCTTCQVNTTITGIGRAGERERDPAVATWRMQGHNISRDVNCRQCNQAGVLVYRPDRISPHNFGLAVVGVCASARLHPMRRIQVSYIALCVLHRLVSLDIVRANANVEAPGASIQRAGNPSSADNQLAHQVLREISINGKFIYAIDNLEQQDKELLIYCHAVCSDIHRDYNTVDGFVEQAARAGYLALVRRIVANEFTMFTNRAYPRILDELITLFDQACDTALARQPGPPYAQILNNYKQAAGIVRGNANTLTAKSTADWHATIAEGGIQQV